MQDPFFSERSTIDREFNELSTDLCQAIIDAALRRIVLLEGPWVGAVRLQRLADICAAENVQEIDFWRSQGAKKEAKPLTARENFSQRMRSIDSVEWYVAALGIACLISAWWWS